MEIVLKSCSEFSKPYLTMYHVFTDNYDDFTESLDHANTIIKTWKKQGEVNLRIYEMTYQTKDDYKDDNVLNEDCIFSEGNFPS